MSGVSISVLQELLLCPVCLDLLNDPVMIPCGRSFCHMCINGWWDQEDEKGEYSCPQCKKIFTSRSVQKKSTILSKKVKDLKELLPEAASPVRCSAGPGDVECDSCTGRKRKALKFCLVCQASYCEDHLKPHYQSPAFKKHKLVEACAELQEKICSQHDKLMEIYCRTDRSFICYLCTMDDHKGHDTVTAKAERTEHQAEQMKSQQRIQDEQMKVQELKSLSDLRKQDEHTCEEQFQNILPQATAVLLITSSEAKSRDFLKYFYYLTLDPNTANCRLILCEKNRTATHTNTEQRYPFHPDRFNFYAQVLCKESVCGRHYWEVEWSGNVSISVSYKNITRKGQGFKSMFGYNTQSWCLQCSSCLVSFWHNNKNTTLKGPVSSRIGVHVDHSAGTLSFYSVSDTMRLLHRVHTTFTQPLYAGFRVSYNSTMTLCDQK